MMVKPNVVLEEEWKTIIEFPNYMISDKGRVKIVKTGKIMRTSITSYGNVKITLLDEHTGERYTRSVAQLVGEAFIMPSNILCDQVVPLDGNVTNLDADNLVWRPRWFAWKYSRQFKVPQPIHYFNLPVINVITGAKYSCIEEAAVTEGLLFEDIWRSTYTGDQIFPDQAIFEVL